MRALISILISLSTKLLLAQGAYSIFLENPDFNWTIDTNNPHITFYYPQNSFTSAEVEIISEKINHHYEATMSFMEIQEYPFKLHYFIVESRERMQELTGKKSNGFALPKYNTITGIASANINSIYSNHELFHDLAMNVWGMKVSLWLNEGMAVYSDSQWHGNELHALCQHLLTQNRFVGLKNLIKRFKHVDDMLSYPLAGSFVKYLDETFGREILIQIWKGNSKSLCKLTNRSLPELEKDWLKKVQQVEIGNISY